MKKKICIDCNRPFTPKTNDQVRGPTCEQKHLGLCSQTKQSSNSQKTPPIIAVGQSPSYYLQRLKEQEEEEENRGTKELLTFVDKDGYENYRFDLEASYKVLGEEHLAGELKYILLNEELTDEEYNEIAKIKNNIVAIHVAKDERTSPERLMDLSRCAYEKVRLNIVHNKKTPVELLEHMANTDKSNVVKKQSKAVLKNMSSKEKEARSGIITEEDIKKMMASYKIKAMTKHHTRAD